MTGAYDQREALWEARRCIRPDHLGCNAEDHCHAPGQCQARQNGGVAQSSKEKQEAFRARQAMLGNTEVRGMYAPPSLHTAIKEAARKLVEQHKPEEKK